MTARFLVLVILASLAGCGGGGGGGGVVSGGGGNGGVSPPSLDTLYTGNKAQAQVAESNYAVVAEAAWFGPMTAFVLSQDIVTEEVPDGPVSDTSTGSVSGTVRLSGRITNGTGALTATYSNYNDGDVTLNGAETMTILTRRTMNAGSVRRDFDGLSVRTDTSTTLFYGSVTRTDSTPAGSQFVGSTWQISGDLLLKQASSNAQIRISSLSLTRSWQGENVYNQYPLLSGSARVFESTHGYFDVAFESPVRLGPGSPEGETAMSGSLAVTGADASKLWISPLSPTHVAVELADAGGTQPTRSAVYRWEDEFETPAGATRTAPLTIAGPDMLLGSQAVGAPIPLEGRFSEAGGNGLLRHEWSLLLAPPGSQATLSHAASTRPALLPDVEGAYLLRLRTSDGVNASVDFLSVYANAANQPPTSQPARLQLVLPPSQELPVGSLASIESGRSYMTDASTPQPPRWLFHKPLSNSSYTTQQGANAEFIVEAEQDYLASFMGLESYVGPIPSLNRVWVSAPGNVRFTPPLGMRTIEGGYLMTGDIAGVDIDGNGHPDVVEERYSYDTQSLIYTVLLNRGGARFDTFTRQLQGGAEVSGAVSTVFADVDGDQRVDLVAPDLRGVLVSRQASSGPLSFGAFTVLPEAVGCMHQSAPEAIVMLDVDRDGRKDIVASSPCGSQSAPWVYINDPAQPSGFRTAATLSITPPLRRFAAGDVDGDGYEDLVGYEDGLTNTPLHVWRNMAGGTFQLLGTLTMQPTQVNVRQPITFADMNSDGRADIVFSSSAGVEVILVGAGGALTQRPPVLMYSVSGTPSAERVRVVDLNRDGRLDLANPLGWRRQLVTGDFGPLRAFTSELSADLVVDLNGDGLLDLVGTQGPFIALGAE